MLVRCLYASRASVPLQAHALEDILAQSRRNNPKQGITGLLLFANGIFVQVIEGSRYEISRLLAKIVRDERNTDVEILSHEEITERCFGIWTMGQANMTSINPALLLKYSEKAELDPFKCNSSATMALLIEIAGSGTVANRPS